MSGVSIIRKLLMAKVSIPVMAGVMPQSTALPAIGVMQISGNKHQTLSDDEPLELESERVQVTIVTKNYPDQKSYMRTAQKACKAVEKWISLADDTVICKSITREFVGPDFYDMETGIFMQSVDFMVKYQRST